MLVDGEEITVGTPTVGGIQVSATVMDHFKGPKLIVFKYSPKKRIRVKGGHRQQYTRLMVDVIGKPGEVRKAPKAEKAEAPAVEKAEVKAEPEKKVEKKEAAAKEKKAEKAPAKKEAAKKTEKAPAKKNEKAPAKKTTPKKTTTKKPSSTKTTKK